MLDLAVAGMTCEHCVNAITRAVSALPGVSGVAVDLAGGRVRVDGATDPAQVQTAIEDEGYRVHST